MDSHPIRRALDTGAPVIAITVGGLTLAGRVFSLSARTRRDVFEAIGGHYGWTLMIAVGAILWHSAQPRRSAKRWVWLAAVLGIAATFIAVGIAIPTTGLDLNLPYALAADADRRNLSGKIFLCIFMVLAASYFLLDRSERRGRYRNCPDCLERIRHEAVACRYCGRRERTASTQLDAGSERVDASAPLSRLRWLPSLILFVALLRIGRAVGPGSRRRRNRC